LFHRVKVSAQYYNINQSIFIQERYLTIKNYIQLIFSFIKLKHNSCKNLTSLQEIRLLPRTNFTDPTNR